MVILKCKMCGGDVEVAADKTFGTCEYCGCSMTFPKVDDDQKASMFNRGNHFRRIGEFDKALAVYERIVNEDNTNAEAHWCCALSRFGIEYVEDPATMEWLPTCHRASFDSFLEDVDYLAAVEYSDGITKRQYQRDALKIAEVQKGILSTSQNAEPYDVFICYKESDEHGQRTKDSVLAQEIYYQLTEQGRRVFFSRITLEDVVGTQYEPYIFAALNSAKVMIVVGTKPEYLNAVWVKNEWSRFIAMMKKDRTKLLLPCYRDMDPYDMPEALSVLQSYDMSKIGFIQDLTRGISKVLDIDKPKEVKVTETVNVQNTFNPNAQSLMKRAFIFLEDEEWDKADEYFEKILDLDPENGEAYLGKMLVELNVSSKSELKDLDEPFDDCDNYSKVIRYADSKLKNELEGYLRFIDERNENERLLSVYAKAKSLMAEGTAESYRSAEELFKTISHYQDSAELTEQCKEAQKELLYANAKNVFDNAKSESDFIAAGKLFEDMRDYNDSDYLMRMCAEKAENARKNKILNEAKSNIEAQDIPHYEKAIKQLETISGWKNADVLLVDCKKKIEEIKAQLEAERVELERKQEFQRREAARIAKRNKKIAIITTAIVCMVIAISFLLNTVIIPGRKYNDAIALMDAGKLDEAYSILVELEDYKDAVDKLIDIQITEFQNIKIGGVIKFGEYEQDDNTTNGKEEIEWIVLEIKDGKALVISKYALDKKTYNTSDTGVTWETCTLRKWLNNDFINEAFSAYENAMIPTVMVSADKNPEYYTNQGNSTQDKVFLLSIQEANQYFKNDDERCSKPSKTAKSNGVGMNDNGNCRWWLRSSGYFQFTAAFVRFDGGVYEHGSGVCNDDFGVRPALWINLNS